MSSFAEIGDFLTRTSFEIRKERIPDDVAAMLELICEKPDKIDFDEFHQVLNNLFKDGLSVEKTKSLYNYITNYAICPKLSRYDNLLEDMQYMPFVEIGTLYSSLFNPYRVKCDKENYSFILNEKLVNYSKSSLQLKWCMFYINKSKKYFPGFLLPDNEHFCPLSYMIHCDFPVAKINHKDLEEKWSDSFCMVNDHD